MSPYLDLLLAKAFESFPGESYNRWREALLDAPDRPRVFFEVSLLTKRPWEYLRDRVYPGFTRFLKNKSIDPETGRGVVVTVFHGATCYLLRGEDFIATFREMEGLNPSAYHFRVLQWLTP